MVDALLQRGHTDITVLDISESSLLLAQQRLGTAAGEAQWVVQDLLAWQPPRQFRVWHDRPVFHLLTTAEPKRVWPSGGSRCPENNSGGW